MKLNPKIKALQAELAEAENRCRTLAHEAQQKAIAQEKALEEGDSARALKVWREAVKLWREESYYRGVADSAARVVSRLGDIEHPPKTKNRLR